MNETPDARPADPEPEIDEASAEEPEDEHVDEAQAQRDAYFGRPAGGQG